MRAIDPKTGERKWEFKMNDVTDAGILTTGSDLLFSGGREGYFYALDARNGELLWKANVGRRGRLRPHDLFAWAASNTWRSPRGIRCLFTGCGSRRLPDTVGHQFLSFRLIQTSGGSVRS